jgi:hypothetical protein
MNSDLYHTDDTSAQEPGYGRMNQQVQTVWRGEHGPTRRQLQFAGFQRREGGAQDLLPARLEHGRIDNRPSTTSLTADRPANLQHLSRYFGPRNSAPEQVSHHSHLVLQTLERITGNSKRSPSDYDCKRAATEKRSRNCAINWPNQRTVEKTLEAHLEECKDKFFACSPNIWSPTRQ